MSITGRARALVSGQFFFLILIAVSALANVGADSHQYLILESVLILVGLLILFSAWLALRPSLQISPLPKVGAVFISRGIYKYVRHPMYLALILIGLGAAGFADSALGWISELALMFT